MQKKLLRSSLVSRHTRLRGESWRVRASDPIGSVQARTVGITALEWMGWWPTRHRPIARAWNELVPKVLKNRKCLDTYELLNKNTAEPHQRFSATSKPIGREGIGFLVGSTHDQLGSQGANS